MRFDKRAIFLILFILLICIISLLSCSQKDGFYSSYSDYYQQLNNAFKTPTQKGNSSASGSSFKGWDKDIVVEKSTSTSPPTIKTNADFLSSVTSALKSNSNPTSDLAAIYTIESQIAKIKTTNATNLLLEMANPTISNRPRFFLQYMNWYGINCPIDADTCINVN